MVASCYYYLREYHKSLEWINKVLIIDSSDEESLKHRGIIRKILIRKGGI